MKNNFLCCILCLLLLMVVFPFAEKSAEALSYDLPSTKGNVMDFENIVDSFDKAEKINVYKDGKKTEVLKEDKKFEEIISSLKHIVAGSFEMPAFGVSIDELTREDMKQGKFIELEMGKPCTHAEMPFEALLIKVVGEYQAFNLIRRNLGVYTGRCYHLNLGTNMQELFDIL